MNRKPAVLARGFTEIHRFLVTLSHLNTSGPEGTLTKTKQHRRLTFWRKQKISSIFHDQRFPTSFLILWLACLLKGICLAGFNCPLYGFCKAGLEGLPLKGVLGIPCRFLGLLACYRGFRALKLRMIHECAREGQWDWDALIYFKAITSFTLAGLPEWHVRLRMKQ